jgi:Fur family ferric uptake transcriptional regulator
LKRTRAREAVIRLLASRHGPFTTDEIHRDVSKSLEKGKVTPSAPIPARETCDLATIYRILAKFSEAGVVTRSDFGDGVARFELAHEEGRHHHHVICLVCGKAEPIRGCDLRLQEESLRKLGFTRLSHRLEFFARCPACAAK